LLSEKYWDENYSASSFPKLWKYGNFAWPKERASFTLFAAPLMYSLGISVDRLRKGVSHILRKG